jgi:hypothetical protein
MRSVDQIREAIHRQPFRPFRLDLVDGKQYVIKHPDFIAIPPGNRAREITFFVEAPHAPDGYEAHWIDLGLIVEVVGPVELPATPAPSA